MLACSTGFGCCEQSVKQADEVGELAIASESATKITITALVPFTKYPRYLSV
jgi:hypothetical protein